MFECGFIFSASGKPLLFHFSWSPCLFFKMVSQTEMSSFSIFIYLSIFVWDFCWFCNLRRKKNKAVIDIRVGNFLSDDSLSFENIKFTQIFRIQIVTVLMLKICHGSMIILYIKTKQKQMHRYENRLVVTRGEGCWGVAKIGKGGQLYDGEPN